MMRTLSSGCMCVLSTVCGVMIGCGQADPSGSRSMSNQTSAMPRKDSSNPHAASENTPPFGKLTSATTQRKLVYSGEVKIRTEDFADMEQQIESKLSDCGGFVGSFSETRVDLQERSGIWTVRLPVDQFHVFVRWLDDSFHVVDKSMRSKDMTEEFVDLQSRLSNKRKTEQRLSEHLSKTTSKLSEILEMEKEIERVREDIERIEGRLNLLQDQSELSTLTIRADSQKIFVAPQSPSTIANLGAIFASSCWVIAQIVYSLIAITTAVLPFAFVLGGLVWGGYILTGCSPMRMIANLRSTK